MIHQPDNRYAAITSTKTEGDVSQLATGQLALAFESRLGLRGQAVVDVIDGDLVFPESTEFVLKFGLPNGIKIRGAGGNIGATVPFKKSDVRDMGVFSPVSDPLTVDKIVIGYNGIDDETAPVLYPGESRTITLELYGNVVSWMGYQDGIASFTFPVSAPPCAYGNCEDCDPCEPADMHEIFVELLKQIKNTRVANGGKLGDFIDVELIERCDTPADPTTTTVQRFEVTVPDICGKKVKDYVQASVDFPVEEVSKDSSTGATTFRISLPVSPATTGYTPNDVIVKQTNVIPFCDGTCPDGYDDSSATKGFIYNVTFKPSLSAAADVATAFPVTPIKSALVYENETRDEAQIIVVTDEKVEESLIDAYIKETATNVEFQNEVPGVCIIDEEVTYSWEPVDGCEVAQVMYYLTQEVQPCGSETEIDAVARMLAEIQKAYPYNTVAQVGTDVINCFAKFSILVYTNEVCTPCQYTTSDVYEACRPQNYRGASWYCLPTATTQGTCRVGIKVSGKWTNLVPSDCLRDQVPVIFDSIRLRASAVGGYTDLVGLRPRTLEPWSVQVVSQANEPRLFGYQLQTLVDKDLEYYVAGRKRRRYIQKVFTGQDYYLDPLAQYVDYWVTLDWQHRNADGYKRYQGITYHFLTKFGEHEDVERIMNAIAEMAGKEPLSATAEIEGDAL